jgi:hypothetical protein
MKNIFVLIIATLLLTSCEDVVQIDLNKTTPRINIDAWLTNKTGEQVIKITQTVAYSDTTPAPGIAGAIITVTDNEGKVYAFTDNGNGKYIWKPAGNEVFGKIGNTYTLDVKLNGLAYQSVSKMNPVPAIDSISTEFRKEQLGSDDGYWAVLNANDLPGIGNCYWIKTYKNGKYLSKPGEINIAYDAAFKNSKVDNQPFIVPIAEGINPSTTDRKPPYALNDKIHVEVWSITEEAYDYISQAQTEMTNGGLFATIPSNVTSNIKVINDNGAKKPVGFFCVGAVSAADKTVK